MFAMTAAPDKLDGAKVILWSYLHSEPTDSICAVAVCRYSGTNDFYVFGCDAFWEVVSDSVNHSIDEATDAVFTWDGETGAKLWQLHVKRLQLLETLRHV